MSVTNDFAIDQVDHIFRNVFCQVGDPFDMARGGEAVQGGFGQTGILFDQILQLGNDHQAECRLQVAGAGKRMFSRLRFKRLEFPPSPPILQAVRFSSRRKIRMQSRGSCHQSIN